MHESQAVTFELLQDEPLTAEKTGTQALAEADADLRTVSRAEKGILLADQRAAEAAQLHRHDLAGIRRGEGDAPLALRLVRIDRGEQLFTGHQPLAGAEQLAEQAAALLGLTREGTHEVAPGVYRFGFKRAWHSRRALNKLLAALQPA